MKARRRTARLRRRTLIIAVIAAVLLAGGAVYWFGFGRTDASVAQARTITSAASLETMEKTVETSGTVSPAVQEDVAFDASGTVTTVAVQAGSTVAAGDVLATIDTLTVESDLLDAEATLARAKATLASSEADGDGGTADEAQIAADEASVEVAQAAVDSAATAALNTTLVAPVGGLVTTVGVEVGDSVSSGSGSSGTGSSGSGSSGSGTADAATGAQGATTATSTSTSTSSAAFTIVGTDSWSVDVEVGETDVSNVAVDDQVELTLDDGTAFFGTVSEVGLLPSTTTGAATYPVTIGVTGDADGLYDGVSATAAIVYERRTDVLTVPSAAVTETGGASTVTVVDAAGEPVETPVTVGETSGDLTEIVDGLAEGDEVVVRVFTPTTTGDQGGTDQQSTGDLPAGGPGSGGEPPAGFTPGGTGTDG